MKIDHSWLKAEKSKSVLLPISQYACRSGWRRRRCTPKHSWANPLLFPFPYLYMFYDCLSHSWCAELWLLTAYIKSTVLAHMDRYQTNNSLFDYNSLKSCSRAVHLLILWNEARYLALTTLQLHLLYQQSNKASIHSDNTHSLATFTHFTKRQDSGFLVPTIVCYCPTFWWRKRVSLALHLTSNQKSKCKSACFRLFLFFFNVTVSLLSGFSGFLESLLGTWQKDWEVGTTPHKSTCCQRCLFLSALTFPVGGFCYCNHFPALFSDCSGRFQLAVKCSSFVSNKHEIGIKELSYFPLWQTSPLKPLLLCLMTYKWMWCVLPSSNFAPFPS